ncbi:MAG: zinc-ribbon domain-containing protein [Spirochaetes bacterium]|nr:zinc-ribbon domain-containing protein [Spirochaetota bacterium]
MFEFLRWLLDRSHYKCPRCNYPVSKTEVFCPNCGQPFAYI